MTKSYSQEQAEQHQNPAETPRTLTRPFLGILAAESISEVGSQITLLAIPVVAITILHASASGVGLIQACLALPPILLGLIAGASIDRRASPRVLQATYWLRSAAIALIPVLYQLGYLRVWSIAIIVFLAAGIGTFGDLAVQSYVPDTVPADRIQVANGRMAVAQSFAQVLGPSIAGLLIAAITAPLTVTVDAISFVVAAVILAATMGHPGGIKQRQPAQPPTESLRASIKTGLAFVVKSVPLRAIVISASLLNLFYGAIFALEVIFMIRVLRLPTWIIGVAFSTQGIAAVFGSLVVTKLTRRLGVGRAIYTGLLAEGLGCLVLAVALGPRWLILTMVLLANVCASLTNPLFNVNSITLRQALTPHYLRARVNAAARTMIMGSRPIGAIAGGLLATGLTVRGVMIGSSVGMLAAAIYLSRSPVRSLHEFPTRPDEAPTQPETPHD